MRLAFLGSPQVAVPFLDVCVRSGHSVTAVVAQPDRPSGRGLELKSPAVAESARGFGLPLHQPKTAAELAAVLEQADADLAVVVAYGRILKPEALATARLGFLNVHFSLLPRFRGAAPVQWSLIEGEKSSGVSLFWLDEGMDTGALQSVKEIPVAPNEDAEELFSKLIPLGTEALSEALEEISAGRIRREPQAGTPSFAPKLEAGIGRLSFNMPAERCHNRIRGLSGSFAAHLILRREEGPLRLKVLKSLIEAKEALVRPADVIPPGTVLRVEPKKGILIQFNPGRLWFRDVQPEGKKRQSAADFLNGMRLGAGARLEAEP